VLNKVHKTISPIFFLVPKPPINFIFRHSTREYIQLHYEGYYYNIQR